MAPIPKVITEQVPPDYPDLPEAGRLAVARQLAAQIQAGLPGAGAG